MFIHEKEKLFRKVDEIFQTSISKENVVLLGKFIDVDQTPVAAKVEQDGAIRLIYIDEGSTQLFLKYQNKDERDIIEKHLDDISKYLKGEGYKVEVLFEVSKSPESDNGCFSFSFHR